MASLRIHEDWLAKLAFDVDVTAQMNERNVKLQRRALFVLMKYTQWRLCVVKAVE